MKLRSFLTVLLLCAVGAFGVVLFSDDFSSPEPAKKGWQDYSNNTAPGTFDFENRMLHFPQNMSKSAWLMVGDKGWTNIRISCKLRTRFPEGYGLLIIGGRGDMDSSKLDATYAGWVLSGEGGFKSILEVVNVGKPNDLANMPLSAKDFVMDVWHDVVVEVGAGGVKVVVDGKELQSGKGELPASGKFLIANGFGSETWIKNLKVESF